MMPGRILSGTSGYSYADWVGPFYPPGTAQQDFLAYYSRHFSACELNFTYYRMPEAPMLARMVERSGGRVEFTCKANREMTHEGGDIHRLARQFTEALKPMMEAGVFGCLLAQFPHAFKNVEANRARLLALRDELGTALGRGRQEGLPMVVEFRHRGWVQDAVFDWLRREAIGFCCVDEPALPGLIPPVARVTSEIAYLRLHGRNARKWWRHEQAHERYDYRYTKEELSEWMPRIEEMSSKAKKTYIFANNHYQAKAVENIKQLTALLEMAAAE